MADSLDALIKAAEGGQFDYVPQYTQRTSIPYKPQGAMGASEMNFSGMFPGFPSASEMEAMAPPAPSNFKGSSALTGLIQAAQQNGKTAATKQQTEPAQSQSSMPSFGPTPVNINPYTMPSSFGQSQVNPVVPFQSSLVRMAKSGGGQY